MKLYNTLTRSIDDIIPLNPPTVAVYTCGPTVYDYSHVGHWFNYVRMDTLIRTLRLAGYETNWVMNITDVGHLVSDADEGEDKLEKGARREGKTAWEVAEFYTADFLECMELLNISQPTHIVKATDHIAEQIKLIQRLAAKGYTYTIDDGVYYDTSKFEGYAAFARLDLDELQAGARVAYNQQKRNPTDFALWKFSPELKDDGLATKNKRDMEWDSPFDPSPLGAPKTTGRKGFPGWHIECSAMSMKYLGDTLDIHTGGIDHIQVHHTNEIAQSEAATGKRFANVWMHSNHIMIEGEKVSKSLGNGIRLQEILAKGIPVAAVRLHILESHYRSQSHFSWDSLHASQNRLERWRATASQRWQVLQPSQLLDSNSISDSIEALNDLSDLNALQQHPHTSQSKDYLLQLETALLSDLNTPAGLYAIDQMMNLVENEGMTSFMLPQFVTMLQHIDRVLGIDLSDDDISDEQKKLIKDRETARINKDWVLSDKLRDQLLESEQAITLRDTPLGTIWQRL